MASLAVAVSTPGSFGFSFGQQPKMPGKMRHVTPNQHAPELYSDKLSLKITLVNLPGANLPKSSWEVAYKAFFVAEKDFQKTMMSLGRKINDATPEQFSGRILLVEGDSRLTSLASLPDRSIIRDDVDFKSKIPDDQQTSFASLLIFYSTKIYDSKLRKTAYKSGFFVSPPFDTDVPVSEKMQPRTALYLNFYMTDDGDIYESQLKRNSDSTEWKSPER